MRSHQLFPTGISLVAAVTCSAATLDESAAASIRCRVFSLGKAPSGDVYVRTAGKYTAIVVASDYVGASVRIDAKDGIVFYKKVAPGLSKPGEAKSTEKEHYEPIASCAPDGTASRQLVFIAPDGKNGWRAMAKSDVDATFPSGSRLVFNLSPTPVAVNFGGTELVVNPKQIALLAQAKTVNEGLARVRMARRQSQGVWVPFLSSVWRQTTDERAILLVYPVPGTEEVSFLTIPDRIEMPDDLEKKAAAKGGR